MQHLDPPRRKLAAALAGLAGFVDAVGFLSADRYFVSFMSGNTTRLATDAVLHGRRALVPALLIAGFVLGVAAGSVAAHKAGNRRKPAVLLLVTTFLAAGAIAAVQDWRAGMMACLVLAMGALNNALRRNDTPIALTYLTGALVRIGQWLGAAATGGQRDPVWPLAMVWLSLAGGAATGATMFALAGPASLWIGVAVSAALTLVALRLARVSPP